MATPMAVNTNTRNPIPEITIGNYTFRLIARNSINGVTNQLVIIESINNSLPDEKPVEFAVYRSISQALWRLAIYDSGNLEKLSDYTCTTQLHPTLQEFIYTNYDNIPVDDTIIIKKYKYNYYNEIITKSTSMDLTQAVAYFDYNRIAHVPEFALMSVDLFKLNRLVDVHKEDIVYSFISYTYPELASDIDKYFPLLEDGDTIEDLPLNRQLQIVSRYLEDKLDIVPESEQLEYYIDPAHIKLLITNYESGLDLQASDNIPYIFTLARTTGNSISYGGKSINRILKSKSVNNKTKKNNVPKYVSIFDRSPAVLSVRLQSKEYPENKYILYYFDYRYRGKRYMIPLNIIIDGIGINEFGLPEKYIPLNIYIGKILEYDTQTDIEKGKTYNTINVGDRKYIFAGNLYTNIWPLNKVHNLKSIVKRHRTGTQKANIGNTNPSKTLKRKPVRTPSDGIKSRRVEEDSNSEPE